MNLKITTLLFSTVIFLPVKKAAPPSFSWKPRVDLAFSPPAMSISALEVQKPTLENIQAGTLIMFDGFHAGLALVALVKGIEAAKKFKHHNPKNPYFYTNVYRWAYRFFMMFPKWISESAGHYTDVHKVWRLRYFYMDKFVPQWMRNILNYFVDEEDWEVEEKEFKQFMKYAEPSFGNHYIYPSKVFNNFESQDTGNGTIENLDSSDLSIHQR